MARKIGARLILQQLAAGTSRNAIARSLGVSKHSIQAVAEAAEREKVSWQDAEGMEEGELYSRLFPRPMQPNASIPIPTGMRSTGTSGRPA